MNKQLNQKNTMLYCFILFISIFIHTFSYANDETLVAIKIKPVMKRRLNTYPCDIAWIFNLVGCALGLMNSRVIDEKGVSISFDNKSSGYADTYGSDAVITYYDTRTSYLMSVKGNKTVYYTNTHSAHWDYVKAIPKSEAGHMNDTQFKFRFKKFIFSQRGQMRVESLSGDSRLGFYNWWSEDDEQYNPHRSWSYILSYDQYYGLHDHYGDEFYLEVDAPEGSYGDLWYKKLIETGDSKIANAYMHVKTYCDILTADHKISKRSDHNIIDAEAYLNSNDLAGDLQALFEEACTVDAAHVDGACALPSESETSFDEGEDSGSPLWFDSHQMQNAVSHLHELRVEIAGRVDYDSAARHIRLIAKRIKIENKYKSS